MRTAMKKKAFISGPILGMESNQDYRNVITKICMNLGLEVIDPWHREKILYETDELCWWVNVPAVGFVQRDLEDAERCDIMIVYLNKTDRRNVSPPAKFVSFIQDFFAMPRIKHLKPQLHTDFSNNISVALVAFHAQDRT